MSSLTRNRIGAIVATFVVALALTVLLPVGRAHAAQEPTVTYSNLAGTSSIDFEPADTNLFPNMGSVMPGDEVTQTVTVRNASLEGDSVLIYMRSLGYSSGSEEFLSQMTLTVAHESGNVVSNTADSAGGLTEWVLLGEFAPGQSTQLDVTLTIPIELDNSFQGALGRLKWEFMAEEIPASDEPGDPTDPDNPANPDDPTDPDAPGGTGDGSSTGGTTGGSGLGSGGKGLSATGDALFIMAAVCAVAAAVAALVLLLLWRRRREEDASCQ